MGYFDDDKPNSDHYYSPSDEGYDPQEDKEEPPYSSHYYSPSSDDEDEDVLPFSHVEFDEDEEKEFLSDESEPENADNEVIDGYFEPETEEDEPFEEDSSEEEPVEEDYPREEENGIDFSDEDIDEALFGGSGEEGDEETEKESAESEEEYSDEDDPFAPVEEERKGKVEFIAEDDGYDYSSTDDADDMADDDNVFDKEPEYLFNDEFPEEPEKLGAIHTSVTENDYMKGQISFDDYNGFDGGDSKIIEDFFSTHPKPDGETEESFAEEIEETETEPIKEEPEDEIFPQTTDNGPIDDLIEDEPIEESAATEPESDAQTEENSYEREREIEAEREREALRAREEAFERERQAALAASKAAQQPTAEIEQKSGRYDGENINEQKTIREKNRRMFMEDSSLNVAKIMVCGVGGAGNNAVNRMIDLNVSTAAFVAINTDKQALMLSKCDMENRYQIGGTETKGLGAGADPDVGERAAEESRELIEDIVDGVDLLFIAAGMGGGTGTGAAPVIARIAREKGCVTVAVVTKPFGFEGRRRASNADRGITNLKKYVDTIIIIPNDKLMEALRPDTPIVDALRYADDTLRQGICGIADLIATPSLINLDFADVRTVIKDQGLAHMGIGRAKGDNRIMEAVREAVSSPLLETTIEGARGIILNVTGGTDLTIRQVNDAARQVQDIIDPSANIIFGMNINEKLQEEVIITLIATGFDADVAIGEESEEDGDAQSRAYQRLFSDHHVEEEVAETAEPIRPIEEERPEPERPAEKEKSGIPSFMRRLFKK